MKNGQVLEMGPPQELLQNVDSSFRAMALDAGNQCQLVSANYVDAHENSMGKYIMLMGMMLVIVCVLALYTLGILFFSATYVAVGRTSP